MIQTETKYILGGGFASKSRDGGLGFYSEIARDTPASANVLDVMYAVKPSEKDSSRMRNQKLFNSLLPDRQFEFETADLSIIDKQLERSNIIFLYGGSAEPLVSVLSHITSLGDKLRGKTVVGVSAGAYAISTYFLKVNEVGNISFETGLGLLPITTVTHYRSSFYEQKFPETFSWKAVDETLAKYEVRYESLCLKEGEFRVFK